MDKDVRTAKELEDLEAQDPFITCFVVYRKVIIDLINRVRYLEHVIEELQDYLGRNK